MVTAPTPTPRIVQPPFYDPPLILDGQRHSQAWEAYFQAASDQIAALTAAVADLRSRVATLEGP